MLSKTVAIFVVLSGVKGEIRRDTDLNCDFQGDFCRWQAHIYGKLAWTRVDRVVADAFHSIPRGKAGTGDVFCAVQGTGRSRQAWMLSDIIPCQSYNGTITLSIWKTATNPLLEVCTRQPPTDGGLMTCYTSISGHLGTNWVERATVIPPSTQPFQIVLRGHVTHFWDTMGIDRFSYETPQICSPTFGAAAFKEEIKTERRITAPRRLAATTTTSTTTETAVAEAEAAFLDDSKPFSGAIELAMEAECAIMECDFEKSLCDFEAYGLNTENGGFRFLCHPLENDSKFRDRA